MSAPLTDPHARLRRRYTAVVVGSGHGGGIVAVRLAQAGYAVCVLERGREWQPGQFLRTPCGAERAGPPPARSLHMRGMRARRVSRNGAANPSTGVGLAHPGRTIYCHTNKYLCTVKAHQRLLSALRSGSVQSLWTRAARR